MKLREPQFEGQTKTKLGNTEAKTVVQSVVFEQLGAWFESNPAEGQEIARKAVSASHARMAARKARDLARNRKGLLGGGGLPGKLIDCSSREPENCELFIVEGDSAGGSARQARDPKTQAILPIRGKILNVEKARIDKVLQNNEVQALISAMGAGVQDDFDKDKLRYHKLVLMADADVDGQHIRTLLLTLLFRYMRPLIEHGHVYLGQPPLFKIKWIKAAPGVRLLRAGARRADRGRGGRRAQAAQGGGDPALQGPRRDELAGAARHHDEPARCASCCRSPSMTRPRPTNCS